MARVIIIAKLKNEVLTKFKNESKTIFKLMRSLGDSPHKGKSIGRIGGILIKELKYKNFRFYFIIDENKLKVFSIEELKELLIKFVRMSNKNHQQQTINEIKQILQKIGPEGFD